MKNKGIIIGSVIIGIGIITYVIVKSGKLTKQVNQKIRRNSTDVAQEGVVQKDNWDGRQGFTVKFADGTVEYYSAHNAFVMARDSSGATTITAEYNNWDDEGGYILKYNDGYIEYFKYDDTFDHYTG